MSQFSNVLASCNKGADYVYPHCDSSDDPHYNAMIGLVVSNLIAAETAKNKSDETYPDSTHNGKGDALRHALWSALMCFTMNLESFEVATTVSKIVTETYEELSNGAEIETVMDLANGKIGRRLAKKFAEEHPNEVINHQNQQDNFDYLVNPLSLFIQNEIEAGNLCVIRNSSISPSNLTSKKVPIEISTIYEGNMGTCKHETGFIPGPLFAPISVSIESDAINIHKNNVFTKYTVDNSNLDNDTKIKIKELLSLIKSKTSKFQYFAFDGDLDFNIDVEPHFSWSQGIDLDLLIDINMNTDFYAIESLSSTLGKCNYTMFSWDFENDANTNFNILDTRHSLLAVATIAVALILTLLSPANVPAAAVSTYLIGTYLMLLIDYFNSAQAL